MNQILTQKVLYHYVQIHLLSKPKYFRHLRNIFQEFQDFYLYFSQFLNILHDSNCQNRKLRSFQLLQPHLDSQIKIDPNILFQMNLLIINSKFDNPLQQYLQIQNPSSLNNYIQLFNFINFLSIEALIYFKFKKKLQKHSFI
ncbi:unnamed protein product [Paramecium sonneborni]|uniref:Uncharacterized protein n=1 Tax=Paramecium sonneborni TaxID=65129 RepID=A0A8S1NM22_9CILI|nr:unnamed protein product [Paramecium sonneborni]